MATGVDGALYIAARETSVPANRPSGIDIVDVTKAEFRSRIVLPAEAIDFIIVSPHSRELLH